ncbi:Serine/threonine-protein kinase Sgk2 [Balamuthia mandrillaris]
MGAKASKKKAKQEKGEKSKGKRGKKRLKDVSTTPLALSSSGSQENNPDPVADQEEDGNTDELHPSWNEPILYSKDGLNKLGKEDFELLSVIGKGSFGKVMLVKKKDTGNIYAMKVLRKEALIARKQVAHTKAERSILQKVQHPFIVTLHYAFQTKDKLYMILDYVNGGELFFHLKKEGRFPEERVVLYVAEIVSAIAHLHTLGIVYRDLKPENILLDSQGHVVLTDFGLSKEIDPQEGTQTFCGTPEYLAPEVLKGQGHGVEVDWWSLGTLMYEMLTGLPPFYSQNINIMYQKILAGELRYPSYVSKAAKSLLNGLLTRDVSKRLGSSGADAIKNHKFFAKIDWQKLERREVEPTFKPKVRGVADVSQIDPVFTQEKVVDSVVEDSDLHKMLGGGGSSNSDPDPQHFEGFTFMPESEMMMHK